MFDVATNEIRRRYEEADRSAAAPQLDPGIFGGMGEATEKTIGTTLGQTGQSIDELVTPVVHAVTDTVDNQFGTHGTQWWDNALEGGHELLQAMKPNPRTVGVLGNLEYQIVPPIAQFMVDPVVAGYVQGNIFMDDLQRSGVDPMTALKGGVLQGATTALGAKIPASVGATALQKVASGVAINSAMGMANRGATSALLDAKGYHDMAKQYRVFDGMSMLVDSVFGAAVGGLHAALPHVGLSADHDPLPSEVDTAMAANNIHNLELDSAPGIPADMTTRNAHVDAMNLAAEQMLRGEPVNVGSVMGDGTFVARPGDAEAMSEFRSMLNEQGYEAPVSAPASGQERSVAAQPERPVYAAVPKEPMRFTSWVKKQGGIKDEGGDVRASIGGVKSRPGLISKRGVSIDDLAIRAEEAGYFKQGERPTVNDVIDKINEDHNGAPQYSLHDDNAVHEYNEAHNRNAEIDRIASETGIDPAGKTHGEFWDTVAEHQSVEKRIEEAQSMADAHERDLQAADDAAKRWLEARGDAWEPYQRGQGKPRTLEDLENEYRQEEAARGAQPREENDAAPRPSAENQSSVQERVRQGGSGFGDAGRPSESSLPESEVKSLLEAQTDGAPELKTAQDIVTEKPDMTITGEDGQTIKASDALSGAQDQIAQAKKDSSLFDAAVNCFLRHPK